MNSWKTTVTGICTIVGAASGAVITLVKTGTLDAATLATLMAAVTTGVGLIFARDNNKTSEQVGAGK